MSTQRDSGADDLTESHLESIFSNLTHSSQDSDIVLKQVDNIPKKSTSRFVCHSGLVPYESSETDTSFEDSVDVVNDSPPDSPIFKIPPKKPAPRETDSTHKVLEKDTSKEEKATRFKPVTSDCELQDLAGKTFARSTDRKISWAVNLFRMWRQNRIDEGTGEGEISWCDVDSPDLDPEVLAHVLPTFINEIKRADGEDYPPNTVYSIIVMIQLFFEKKGKTWKLLDGKIFNSVRNTVDNIMKRRSMARIAQKVKRSEPISIDDKEEM